MARERGRELFTVDQWRDDLRPSRTYAGLLCPGSVDHVLYLIHHALIHHALMMGVQPFVDVGLWTQSWASGDWDALQSATAYAEMDNAVGLALALTGWLWDRPQPGGNRFPQPPDALLSRAKATAAGTASAGRLPHVWRDMPSSEQGGIFCYIRTILLGDPAQLRELSFKERLRYHIQRPGQLFHNHGTSLWQLAKGDPASRAAWRAQRDLQTWLRGKKQRLNVCASNCLP